MRRLTEYSPGGGCACKFPQSRLDHVLREIRSFAPPDSDPGLLIGLQSPDDAAVYAVDQKSAKHAGFGPASAPAFAREPANVPRSPSHVSADFGASGLSRAHDNRLTTITEGSGR